MGNNYVNHLFPFPQIMDLVSGRLVTKTYLSNYCRSFPKFPPWCTWSLLTPKSFTLQFFLCIELHIGCVNTCKISQQLRPQIYFSSYIQLFQVKEFLCSNYQSNLSAVPGINLSLYPVLMLKPFSFSFLSDKNFKRTEKALNEYIFAVI